MSEDTGIRKRFRTHVRLEVKTVALRQLEAGGPTTISVNAIARELGVSGPALYRYFSSRDELLAELIADAYLDLAEALRSAVAKTRTEAASVRLRSFGQAYRDWALQQPHRYRLLFRAPVPGYDPYTQRLVAAAHLSMDVLLDLVQELPASRQPPGTGPLDSQLRDWLDQRNRADVTPAAAHRAVSIWARMHGLVSLEVEGAFASMGIDAGSLYADELEVITGPYRD
jgi:AcrR family transcriptional regulator